MTRMMNPQQSAAVKKLKSMRYDEFCATIQEGPELTAYMRVAEVAAAKAREMGIINRFDAAIDTGLIARSLIYVKTQLYLAHYPEFKARQLIPVANDTPAGADSISTFLWDGTGEARIIANHADDLPRADAFGSEALTPVRTLGIAFAYSVLDLARAAMTGRPLDTMKAMRARRGMEQAIENIASLGDADSGVNGILNNSNVPIDSATGAWSGLTAAQILADMFRMCTNMVNATGDTEEPDAMALPIAAYALASQIPYSTLNGATVLSVFLANNPYIKSVTPWVKLNTAGGSGATRAWVYKKNPDVLTLEMPLEYTQLPPEPRNLDFVINAWARCGGVTVRYPLANRFMDGV